MKRLVFFAVTLVAVVSSLAIITQTPKVEAANARCWVATVAGGGFASCSESAIAAAFGRKLWAPLPDHCYLYGGGDDLQDVPCSQAPFSGARCYTATAYGGGETACSNPAIAAAFTARGQTPLTGHCYIYDGHTKVLTDVGCTHPVFGQAVQPQPTTPTNPTTPGGNGQPSVEQGSAPGASNADKADPDKAPVTRQDNAGFDQTDPNCNVGNQGQGCSITDRLNAIANVLSAGVGIIIVIVIIVGGIQYASAGGDANKVAAAKGRIQNAIYALIAFFFLYAFLQWLVPGGIF